MSVLVVVVIMILALQILLSSRKNKYLGWIPLSICLFLSALWALIAICIAHGMFTEVDVLIDNGRRIRHAYTNWGGFLLAILAVLMSCVPPNLVLLGIHYYFHNKKTSCINENREDEYE